MLCSIDTGTLFPVGLGLERWPSEGLFSESFGKSWLLHSLYSRLFCMVFDEAYTPKAKDASLMVGKDSLPPEGVLPSTKELWTSCLNLLLE